MHLVTQMRWRLRESRNRKVSTGHGEAVYRVGVEDNGNPKGLTDEFMYKSLCTIKRMADAVNVGELLARGFRCEFGKVRRAGDSVSQADMYLVEMKTGVTPGSRVAMVVVKERLSAPKGHTEARGGWLVARLKVPALVRVFVFTRLPCSQLRRLVMSTVARPR
jgi:GTPase